MDSKQMGKTDFTGIENMIYLTTLSVHDCTLMDSPFIITALIDFYAMQIRKRLKQTGIRNRTITIKSIHIPNISVDIRLQTQNKNDEYESLAIAFFLFGSVVSLLVLRLVSLKN